MPRSIEELEGAVDSNIKTMRMVKKDYDDLEKAYTAGKPIYYSAIQHDSGGMMKDLSMSLYGRLTMDAEVVEILLYDIARVYQTAVTRLAALFAELSSVMSGTTAIDEALAAV